MRRKTNHPMFHFQIYQIIIYRVREKQLEERQSKCSFHGDYSGKISLGCHSKQKQAVRNKTILFHGIFSHFFYSNNYNFILGIDAKVSLATLTGRCLSRATLWLQLKQNNAAERLSLTSPFRDLTFLTRMTSKSGVHCTIARESQPQTGIWSSVLDFNSNLSHSFLHLKYSHCLLVK